MLPLLASPLLQKRLLAAWKAARKRGKNEPEWRAKKRRPPERSCLPTAATLLSAMNGDFGTSPPKKGDHQTSSRRAYPHSAMRGCDARHNPIESLLSVGEQKGADLPSCIRRKNPRVLLGDRTHARRSPLPAAQHWPSSIARTTPVAVPRASCLAVTRPGVCRSAGVGV
jgi:hypothetical protein